MRRSVIAALIVLVLGWLSMGVLGMLLYYAAAPVLWPLFGDVNQWSGDDVWPALIGVGMLWSTSFLAAGWLDRRLERAGWPSGRRRAVYALVLWLGAALWWIGMATSMDIRFAAAPV